MAGTGPDDGARHLDAGNVSAVASFSTSGELVNFVSDDRFRTVNGKAYERLRWSTPVSRWHEFEGRRVISAGEALWGPGGHEFAYARIELLDIQYNCHWPLLGRARQVPLAGRDLLLRDRPNEEEP